MTDLGYSVILVDSELCSVVGAIDSLKNMCNQLIVLTKMDLYGSNHQRACFLESIATLSHKEILYVTRNQANIYRMYLMYQDIACCFVNDSRIDYLGIEAQHEIPNVMQLSRVRRSVRLP